ncbi:hypothetical protein [Rhizobacter sp. LjRoot28]|uniref:hypothetical protein n=1 Tax=Rhizobacter sp. LjRoot28 TaxID=3342309 RepID=UPI003ED12639
MAEAGIAVADIQSAWEATDLSAGTPPVLEQAKVNLGLEELYHRRSQQLTLLRTALSLVALLFLAAVIFGGVLIHAVLSDPRKDLHWHASILVAAFVVPPTVILIALLRGAYARGSKDPDETLLPMMTLVRETAGTIADIVKKA